MDNWTHHNDNPSDEMLYMTPREREINTRIPIHTNSVIVGGNDRNDEEENTTLNDYVNQGLHMIQQQQLYNNRYNRNNDLAKKEKSIANELDNIQKVTSKIDNIVKILTRDCREIPFLSDMIKKYYEHTRSWYPKKDDPDNLQFIEDTEIIHPSHKIFQMYDMLNMIKTDSDIEDYKNISWTGLSHIFTQKLDKCVSPQSWMKIAIMNYCATHVEDSPLTPKEIFREVTKMSNGIQSFLYTVSPRIKMYIMYSLLFSDKWTPTVTLEPAERQQLNFVNQNGVLTKDIADLNDFCIIHNKLKNVYIYIHNRDIKNVEELPTGVKIFSTIDYLLYDEKRFSYINDRWFGNLTRPRRIVCQSVNSKELKERMDLHNNCDPNLASQYLGDYENNRAERLNNGNSMITSDLSYLKDSEYKRSELEAAEKEADIKMRELLVMKDKQNTDNYAKDLKKDKKNIEEEIKKYRLAKDLKEQLNDVKRRIEAKQSSENLQLELVKLKNENLISKMEYQKQVMRLKEKHHDILKSQKMKAIQEKETKEIEKDIAQLADKYSEKEATLKHREYRLQERRLDILNNLQMQTFKGVADYANVTNTELNQAMERYKSEYYKNALTKNQTKLRKVNEELKTKFGYNNDVEMRNDDNAEEAMEDGGGGGSGSDDKINEHMNALQIANSIKDLRIIGSQKLNKDYVKTISKEVKNYDDYYKQLGKFNEKLNLANERLKWLRQEKKMSDHDYNTLVKNEKTIAIALEKANNAIKQQRQSTSTLLSNVLSSERKLLEMQLEALTAGMSKKMKDLLDNDADNEIDNFLKYNDKIDKIQDLQSKMGLAAAKSRSELEENTKKKPISDKNMPYLLKFYRDDMSSKKQTLVGDRRSIIDQEKNIDALKMQHTKALERRLNQSIKELQHISKNDESARKQMQKQIKKNADDFEKFKKANSDAIGHIENFAKDLEEENDDDDNNDNIRTTFLAEEIMQQLYDKIESTANLIQELPTVYEEYITTINEAGINLNEDNPYKFIDERCKALLDSSTSKYIRVSKDLYESGKNLYNSIKRNMNKLYDLMNDKLGLDNPDEYLEDCSDEGATAAGLRPTLARRTYVEDKAFHIIEQANDVCEKLTTECTKLLEKYNTITDRMQDLQSKLNISETKVNTSSRTIKLQHTLIQSKHKEINKSIQQFQNFFKSNLQNLFKLTEKLISENKKKSEKMKSKLNKIVTNQYMLQSQLENYNTRCDQLNQQQQDTVSKLIDEKENEILEHKRRYSAAFNEEIDYRNKRLRQNDSAYNETKKSYETEKEQYVQQTDKFIDHMIAEINNDINRQEAKFKLEDQFHKSRVDAYDNQLSSNPFDITKNVDSKLKEHKKYLDDRKKEKEEVLKQFTNQLNAATQRIINMNSTMQHLQPLKYLHNDDLKEHLVPTEKRDANPFPSQVTVPNEPMDTDPPTGPPKNSSNTTTITVTYTTPTTSTTTTSSGGSGGGSGDGSGGGSGGSSSSSINLNQVIGVPQGKSKKTGGKLLVINDNTAGNVLIREGNDRIDKERKDIELRNKQLDKREEEIIKRQRELHEKLEEDVVIPEIKLKEELLQKELSARHIKMFNVAKNDLINRLSAELEFVGTEKSTLRKQFIDESKIKIQRVVDRLNELNKIQLEPGTDSKLLNEGDSILLKDARQLLWQNPTTVVNNNAPPKPVVEPISVNDILQKGLNDLTNATKNIENLTNNSNNSIQNIFHTKSASTNTVGEIDDEDVINDIASMRAQRFENLINNVRNKEKKKIEKYYDDRINKYIDKCKRKQRFETLCSKASKNREVANANRGFGINHISLLNEDIIFLERSTLAHDDNVPQLNHDNINILYKQLRRKWELIAVKTFQSMQNVNINGVKTGESVDIIFILENIIKNCLKLLTDNRIEFKIIISNSDIALNEYELFYELECRKSDSCVIQNNKLFNNSREETSVAGNYHYNLDKEIRKIRKRKYDDDNDDNSD